MRRIRTAALLLAVLSAFAGCGGKRTEEPPLPDATPEPTEEIDESPSAEATFRRSTLYYLSDEGYLVPVTKLIPWETGIARACLSYMTGSPANDAAAGELGLRTAIPEGTEYTISIKDGCALVNITSGLELPNAKAELDMIEAIVNALTEFPTVTAVTITVRGSGGKLKNGVELPVRSGAYPLNPEESELAVSGGASPATLYFPNLSGAVPVPVTRYLEKSPTIYSLVSALIAGTNAEGLRSCFPENTLLLGATLENEAATINLSEDFKSVSDVEGLYGLAVKTLWLTLAERYEFTRLRIQVNGVDYSPEEAGAPEYVNLF